MCFCAGCHRFLPAGTCGCPLPAPSPPLRAGQVDSLAQRLESGWGWGHLADLTVDQFAAVVAAMFPEIYAPAGATIVLLAKEPRTTAWDRSPRKRAHRVSR